ncbi:MAG: hypothetical protein ACRDFB_09355 [Rhabdochlamydiaceae bacterium]
MQIHYGVLDSEMVDLVVKKGARDRIVSIDLETKVIDRNFLTNEPILGISLSRRTSDIETEVYVLEEEGEEGEIRLLTKLDDYLKRVRPLIVIGFNHRGYDNVLLSTKERLTKGLWGIRDTLQRSYMLDIIHAARFVISEYDSTTPKILPLTKVIAHPLFSGLPLMRNKSILDPNIDKGKQIYELWKNNLDQFRRYAVGDSHDTLLLFEKIFHLDDMDK